MSTMFQATQLNQKNKSIEGLFKSLFLFMTVLLIIPVVIILGMLISKGAPAISLDFFLSHPTNGMTEGGIFPALVGTMWLVLIALIISVPIGVAAAIYLNEYAGDNWLHQAGLQGLNAADIIETNYNGGDYTPANGAVYPSGSFGDQLQVLAQVIH